MVVHSREGGKNDLHQVEAGGIIYRVPIGREKKRQRMVFGGIGKICIEGAKPC